MPWIVNIFLALLHILIPNESTGDDATQQEKKTTKTETASQIGDVPEDDLLL